MAVRAFKFVAAMLPLLFAIGFLAPVISQAMVVLDIEAPMQMSRIQFALIIAGLWGLVATLCGRWL